MKTKAMFFVLIATASLAFVIMKIWTVNTKDSKIEFTASGPMGKVNGSLGGLHATVNFDPDNLPGSSIVATVEVSTIETGIALRNKDLKEKEEWFNVVKYPQISIKSTQIEKVGEGYKLSAGLTIKGVTKAVEIPFSFSPVGDGGVFKAHFTINRDDFKLGASGGVVGKDVTINLEVPVSK